jgi:hypothetical protein
MGDRKAVGIFFMAGLQPAPDSPEKARVTKISQGGLEIYVESFVNNKLQKFLGTPEIPLDLRSACATEVQAKVALGNGACKPSWSTGSRSAPDSRRSGTFVLLARCAMSRYCKKFPNG